MTEENKQYYTPNEDGSIGCFADYKFCEEALEAPEKIVQGYDGNYYFESKCPVEPKPTIEEQNEVIRQAREKAFEETSDPLKQDYDEALARGEADAEEKKQLWLASKDKVREDNPYVVEPPSEPEVIPSEEPLPEEVFPVNSDDVPNQVIDK